VKMNRRITHVKRLRNVRNDVELFFERMEPMISSGKLGGVLFQFPPNFGSDEARLEELIASLPGGAGDFSMEFRNESWITTRVVDILSRRNIDIAAVDLPGGEPFLDTIAGHKYFRFHGSSTMIEHCYSEEELEIWAGRILKAAERVERVYVYFNNDYRAFAVKNAERLRELLGLRGPGGAGPGASIRVKGRPPSAEEKGRSSE